MLNLKEKVFGDEGYSSDLELLPEELEQFRALITEHWLSTIEKMAPELLEEARELGVEQYHLISDRLDHKRIWPKCNRILPQSSVQQLRKLPFLQTLRDEFGEFQISDAYDTKVHKGVEEIYWRLVRPNKESDVGPLHKDTWFHGPVNNGYGMFADDEYTVKLWGAICCTPDKSGLSIAPRSHYKNYKYHIEVEDDVPRPKPDEDMSNVGAILISTEPGRLLLFNEDTLHGGVINRSDKTRVSIEITLVMKKNSLPKQFIEAVVNNKRTERAHV